MEHYFTNNTNLKSKEKHIEFTINNRKYKFITDNGVFSKKGLDFGTRTLLETIPLDRITGNVLDFGCGYGPIGIVVATNTSATVDMLDINNRSLKLALKNAELNQANVNLFASNCYEAVTEKYDFIISNPPIRVGKEILYKILFEAQEHLKTNGELWIVINKNQGAKTVVRDLSLKYKTEILAKSKGFYIICAVNN